MSLKNFARSVVLVGLGTVYATVALAETARHLAKPPVKAAPARSHRDDLSHATDNVSQASQPDKRQAEKPDQRLSSGDAQDELIGAILGVAGSKPAPKPVSADTDPSLFKFVVVQPETSGRPPSTKPSRQNGYGALFGRIIRVDLDTNTVDIQFEGSRQTTVGSKFSVEHDYAFTTEYLGKLEVVYLAGGNRAIAKPGQRTDITRMGKGDRVGGRVVPNAKGSSAGGTNQPAAGSSSAQDGAAGGAGWQSEGGASAAPSCVTPPIDKMPLPPPDPTLPYAPEADREPEEPGPAPGITQLDKKRDSLAGYRSVLSREPSNALANTVRQDAAAAVAQRPSALSAVQPVRTVALPADPTQSVEHPSQQRAQAPLPVRVRPSGPAYHAPREKWTGLTARSWDALLKANRNSPATISLARQSAKTATLAGPPSKSLWCAVKPKPAGAANAAHTAALPARPAQQPTILLFESE